ncbi:kelch motif family protein [Naegleria gruberi]|uniref:Kelch motif family protein n=1 Tax=Naegleria gruberi TaxID=5762 RepID=D2V3Z4_NAEGR|nr:kelch motif family protein [Naegleria gruberi]EFC48288.1 kelch motif family protein [Naegleria gruberi]|eukprot:XP_002681032.1 kelch motif family protein [Naegleria gruberi strain NEG-M]
MVRSDLKVKWKLRNSGQVTIRAGHCAANIPGTPLMYVFGGSNNHLGDHIPSKEFDVYNCNTNSWRRAGIHSDVPEEDAKIPRPKPVVGSSLVGVERGQMIGELSYATSTIAENQEPHSALILYAGWSSDSLINDLWKFNCKTEKWINLTDKQKGSIPSLRSNHSAVVIDNQMLVFGGIGEELEDLKQDMYILDLQTLHWRKVALEESDERPPASRSHACCVHRKSMILFGGGTDKVCFNHLYRFDLEVERWTKIKPNKSEELKEAERDPTKPIPSNLVLIEPEPRMFPNAVIYDTDRMFLFGGRNGKQKINEVWQFDFLNNQWNLMQVGDYSEDDNSTLVLNDDDMAGVEETNEPSFPPVQAQHAMQNDDMTDASPLPSPLTPFLKKHPIKPTPRTGGNMTVVTTGKTIGPKFDKILVFGGNDTKGKLNEVWELIVNQRTYTKNLEKLVNSSLFSDIDVKLL